MSAEGPGWAAPAAATAAWLAAAWGLAGPFLEIFLLSRKTGEQVEDAVTVREPLQVHSCTCRMLLSNNADPMLTSGD